MGILDPVVIQRETLGTKLRRLARRAELSNPLINPPWTAPAAWVANTVYNTAGTIVANAGSWYGLLIPGTAAASGGPSTVSNSVVDNTCTWTYLCGATISASDAQAPTFTTSTAGTPTGLTTIFKPSTFPNVFKVTGGYPSVFSTDYWAIKTFDSKLGTTDGLGGEVSFYTDAAKFAVGFTNGTSPVRVIIDGRYFSLSSQLPATGATPNWFIFDFSATTGRKRRRVTVEGGKSGWNFAGVRCTALDQVWAPETQDDVRVAVISDSLVAGSSYGPFLPGGMLHQQLGKLLGWSDVWAFAKGGTGYLNPGTSSFYTFRQRVAEALTRTPDLWLPFGSTNDTSYSAAAVQAEALATYQAIRNGGSKAPIIDFGLWPINDANLASTEAAVQAAVTQFNDPLGKTFFIPIYADPSLPWVTGAWNNSANTSSVNSTMYIGGDNTHPPEAGTGYLAQRMDRAIRTLVLPNLK